MEGGPPPQENPNQVLLDAGLERLSRTERYEQEAIEREERREALGPPARRATPQFWRARAEEVFDDPRARWLDTMVANRQDNIPGWVRQKWREVGVSETAIESLNKKLADQGVTLAQWLRHQK